LTEAGKELPTLVADKFVYRDLNRYLGYNDCNDVARLMNGNYMFTHPKGKLTTRLQKAVIDTVGKDRAKGTGVLEFIETEVSILFNAYRKDINFWRMTDFLSWPKGHYSDMGSCMFNSRPWSRALLVQYGAYAIQVHGAVQKEDGTWKLADGRGKGRCWVMPMEDGNFYIRNFYGISAAYVLEVLKNYYGEANISQRAGAMSLNGKSISGGEIPAYDNGGGYFISFKDKEVRHSNYQHVGKCRCVNSGTYQESITREQMDALPTCVKCPFRVEVDGEVTYNFDGTR
jgi:hypothetical protein